jgi:ketosteroid isomerase-like protein
MWSIGMNDVPVEVDTIRDLERQRYRAMRDGDVDALDALFAEELCHVHSDASRDSKLSLLAKIRDHELRCPDVRVDPDDHVIIAGDTALATGQVSSTVYVHGIAATLNNRALAVWTRQRRRWRLLAYQSTPIPTDHPSPTDHRRPVPDERRGRATT